MTTATHTFPNGCQVQIDLDAIPDEARWLTMEPSGPKPHIWWWSNRPRWCSLAVWARDGGMACPVSYRSVPITGTLPAWSECIIDLEAVRAEAMTDDGQYHSVDWHGTFMGTDSDPRETGWCDECQAEVYDGDPMGHTNRPDDGPPRLYDVVKDCLDVKWVVQDDGGGRFWGLTHNGYAPVHGFEVDTIIARNVYDIREAMRLMGEAE